MARSPIIIPGKTMPGREIFVPKTAVPKYRCTVPTSDGGLCGKPFYEDEFEAFVRHARDCARANEGEIAERSPRRQMPAIYDPEMWDPEYETHMRNVGRRMAAEGRVVQRPNER